MSDCIVTAAIELDYYQPDGYEASLTRGYEPSHYYAGIKSLDNLGKDLLLYTTEKVEKDIKEKVPDLKNIKYITDGYKKLNPFYDEIFAYAKSVVDKNPKAVYGWNPMFATSRYFILYDAAKRGYKNTLWMDAGLSNESYIPSNYGGTQHDYKMQNWDNYYPNNKNDIFHPCLGQRFFDILNEKSCLLLGLKYMNQEPYSFLETLSSNIPYWSMTGGFIGINDIFLEDLYNFYCGGIESFLRGYNLIFTEIELFSLLNIKFDLPKISFSNFELNEKEDSLFKLLRHKIYNENEICYNNTYTR